MSNDAASSGHWNVTIEPFPRIDDRVPIDSLRERITEARVMLRGWDYPHLEDQLGPPVDRGITCVTEWREYHERWVFMQSGYFAHRWRIREDGIRDRYWTLDFISAMWSITEIWQFAKGLYGADESVDSLAVSMTLDGMKDRRLMSSPEIWLHQRTLPAVAEIPFRHTLSTAALRSDAEGPAVDWSQRLFHLMGVDISVDVLRDHQQRLLSRRYS
jgi:hypothetical protein